MNKRRDTATAPYQELTHRETKCQATGWKKQKIMGEVKNQPNLRHAKQIPTVVWWQRWRSFLTSFVRLFPYYHCESLEALGRQLSFSLLGKVWVVQVAGLLLHVTWCWCAMISFGRRERDDEKECPAKYSREIFGAK